jgi:hypothetical protein
MDLSNLVGVMHDDPPGPGAYVRGALSSMPPDAGLWSWGRKPGGGWGWYFTDRVALGLAVPSLTSPPTLAGDSRLALAGLSDSQLAAYARGADVGAPISDAELAHLANRPSDVGADAISDAELAHLAHGGGAAGYHHGHPAEAHDADVEAAAFTALDRGVPPAVVAAAAADVGAVDVAQAVLDGAASVDAAGDGADAGAVSADDDFSQAAQAHADKVGALERVSAARREAEARRRHRR